MALFDAKFLAKNAMRRIMRFNEAAYGGLGIAVSLGDRVEANIDFIVHLRQIAEQGQGNARRRIGQLMGERQKLFRGRRVSH